MKKFDWFLSTLRKSPRSLRVRRIPRRTTNHRGPALWSYGGLAERVELLEDRSLLSVVWASQGPTTVLNGQVEGIADGEVIGAVHVVLPHPTNADIMYVGSVNGGVWKTTNATSSDPTWTPIFDQQTSLSIGAMSMDPADPDRILVGFGRFSSFSAAGDIGGLALTENGGSTWTEFDVPRFRGQSISGVALRGETMLVALSSFFGDGNPGGMFRSTDGGMTFSPVDSPMTGIPAPLGVNPVAATATSPAVPGVPAGGVFDLVGDPSNPARLYAAGTAGIFRTDDTGATWTNVSGAAGPLITLGSIDPATNAQISGTNNIELAVHNHTENGTNAVYAVIINNGITAGVFRSDDGVDGIDNDGMNGTDDAAETNFVAMDVPTTLEGPVTITDVSNTSPIFIASPRHGLREGKHRIQISGVTGTTAANGEFTITVPPNSPDGFSLDDTTGNGAYTGGGVWRIISNLQPRIKPGGQGAKNLSVVADPVNPFLVYVGGDRQDGIGDFNGDGISDPNSVGATSFTARIFRGDASVPRLGTSVTVGVPNSQWTPLTHSGTASNSAPHADSRDMVFDLNGNLIEADDGGINRRTSPQNSSGDWFSMIGNLAVTEMHDIAYDSNSNTLISGNQDTGTTYGLTPIGSREDIWDSLGLGDGGDVAVDNVTFASQGRSIRYSSNQELGGFKRTVWDSTGALISSTPIARTLIGGGNAFSPQFVTPVVLNEINPLRLILGGRNSVYESQTQGDTITELMGMTTDAMGNPINVQIGNATAIAYGGRQGGVSNPDVLYVAQSFVTSAGTQVDNVFVRTTAGGPLTQAAALPAGINTITDIVIDPNNWARAWVTDLNQVFETTNAGLSWREITGSGGTSIRTLTLAAHPTNPQFRTIEFVDGFEADYLVVGALGGVFVTSSSPASPNFGEWSLLGTGLPNTLVWDMDYSEEDDLLAVGTLGRGAWTVSGLLRELEPPDPFAIALGASGNDVPVAIALAEDGGYAVVGNTLSFNGDNQDIWLSRFDSRGNLMWTRTYAGSFFVQLTGTLDPDNPANSFATFSYDSVTDIAASPDGGFIITGRSQHAPGGASDGLVFQVNSVGDVVGASLHSFAHSPSDSLNSVAETGVAAGSVTLTVDPTGAGISSGFVTYWNIGGTLYGEDPANGFLPSGNFDLSQVIDAPGGDFIAAIGTQFGGLNSNTFVAKFDGIDPKPNGIALGDGSEVGVSIAKTPFDPSNPSAPSFLGVLSRTTGGTINSPVTVIVRKLDADTLLPVWERTINGATMTGNSYGRIAALPDGGFLVAAVTEVSSLFGTGSNANVLLTKLNADGQIVWSKVYGGRGTEPALFLGETLDLIVTPDGYAFTAATNSFGTDDSLTTSRDFWVVKTDLDGNIPVMTGIMRDVTSSMTVTPISSTVRPSELLAFNSGLFPPLTAEEIAEGVSRPVINIELFSTGGTINDLTATNRVAIVPRVQSTTFYNAGSFQFATDTAEATEVTFDENGTPSHVVDVIVTRTDATHGAYGEARVNYSITFNGGATSSDFSINPLGGGSTFIDFADGETSKTAFRIFAWNDNDFDPSEAITITLVDPDPLNDAVIGTRASTTITAINTNPAPGIVQFTSATYSVDENKPSITITVERTDVTATDMQVSYAIIGGTATGGAAGVSGRDYETNHQTSGTFLFDNGKTSHTFTIPIIDDPDVEGDETILLALSNPTNGGLLGTNATATVTIRDIQPPPPLEIVPKFNGKIAFVGPFGEERDTELLVMDANGSNVTNLSNSTSLFESSPAWSPDGSKLAFAASGQNAMGDDISGIYVVNADGTGLNRITNSFRDTDPVWSPDGTRIAYVHGDPFAGDQLVTIDPDGTDPDILITVIGVLLEPKWAPDGRHITYEGRPFTEFGTQLPPTLVEIGVDGFGARVLFPSFSTSFDGSYTPDGTQMVFRGTLEGDDAIFRANVDGSGTPERLTDPVDSPFLSPDGTRLAYFIPGFDAFVAVSNLDGSGATSLQEGYFPGDPAWQPLFSNPEPDTQAPSVASVAPSVATITDDFIGEANFSLTVVFSEAMNPAFVPTISFPVENPLSTLTFNADESGWTSSTTYVAKYDVTDAGKTLSSIDVRVTGGKDVAGNSHNTTTSADEFNIAMAGTFHDMTPPKLTSIQRSNPSNQQTTASTLVFLVSFDEEIDPTTLDPTDFVVNGSTATVTSVVPDLFFGAIFSEVTVSGGNLATFNGSVGLSLNPNTDIVDTVGNPVSLMPPEVSEVYLHSSGTPNRVPSFTKGSNQTVSEDSGEKTVANWATNISAGTGDVGQTVDFQVTNSNNALFSSQPAISHDGTLTFTPAPNAFGTATVTVRIHDDGGTANGGVDTSAAQTFTVTVKSVNDTPTSSAIAPIVINEDSSTGPISFTVGDAETAADKLTLKVLSSTNTKMIPTKNIVLGGSGANRTLTVTPAANRFGTATIAFSIKDADGAVLTQNVQVTVNPVNDAPPTITNILDVTVAEDTPTSAIKFTIDDADDKLVDLNAVKVTATSSNTALVPNLPANIVLGGSKGKRTIQVVPLADQFGTATITVTATDSSGATATDTFVLTVTSVNDPPRVTAATFSIPEFTTNETVVGTIEASDTEGDAITGFSISGGNTGNAFKIDNAGVIRVNDATKIDFEALAQYSLTIKATDALGTAGSKSNETGPITVNVEDQDFAFTVDPVDTDNTVTVSKVGNNLVARRGEVDLITPTSLDDVTSLTITGGTAKDTIILDASLNSAGTPSTKKFMGQILINGNDGDDKLDASKITVATIGLTFNGGTGNDTALGGGGNDTLTGGDGNDSLDGGSGNDQLRGDGGSDALLGGKGDDTFFFSDTDSSETDTLTEATKAGTDTLDFSDLTTAVAVNLNSETALATHANRVIKTSGTGTTKLAPNFENVIGGAGNDSIVGNAAANSLLGGTGNDTIIGGGGNDSVNGGVGNDAIRGDDGNDLLDGDAENDTIIGGAGNDTVRGGDGSDTVIGGAGKDRVFGDAGSDLGLAGKGGAARGGSSKKDRSDVVDTVSTEVIDEAFATVFAFE